MSQSSKFRQSDFVATQEVLYEFDEYRYFGDVFQYTMFKDQYRLNGDKAEINPNPSEGADEVGKKSLFSSLNTVLGDNGYRRGFNMPLYDAPDIRQDIKNNTACTIKDLVDASARGELGRAVYQYSDFMFCRDLGKMPNNHLITLRRFPEGCGDHINYTFRGKNKSENATQMHMPDIGRMVTWLGTGENTMDKVLSYNFNMPYEELNAKFDEGQGTEGGGMLKSLFQACDKTYQAQVLKGNVAGKSIESNPLTGWMNTPQITDWNVQGDRAKFLRNYDESRSYGPLDVVMKTSKRKQGLEYSHSYNIIFNYELRSYDGINSKSAFIDLLANILTVCYTSGKFWGGARINTGSHQSAAFANLPIWKAAESGDFGQTVDALFESLSQIGQTIKSQLSNPKELIGKLVGGFGSMLIGGMLNKLGRPDKFAYNSLLTDAPVGMWHVTIGNPRNPILQEGNLIMKDCKITHSGPLGLDDFPTNLKVEVSLAPAMPRDQIKIEQMYLMGDARVYTPMSVTGKAVYEHSARYNTDATSKKLGNVDDINQKQSSADRTKSRNSNSLKNSKASWIVSHFGMPENGDVYSYVNKAFNGAFNGSESVRDVQAKK